MTEAFLTYFGIQVYFDEKSIAELRDHFKKDFELYEKLKNGGRK